ncbi:MAG TPA: hypothetical protein VE524_10280, partial [Nitrososphaeraceae archaeon]|nr:hypothetical protein [Nitrososphaeraceae archaeon]
MNLLIEQIKEPVHAMDSNDNTDNQVLKYVLKCDTCQWNTSFYESTEGIYLDSKKMHCPMCEERQK